MPGEVPHPLSSAGRRTEFRVLRGDLIIHMLQKFVHKGIALVFLALLVVVAGGLPVHGQQWTLAVDSQPRRISADGRSTSQITALVSSPQTGPAPDGTEVRFTTTAGSVMPVARTMAGKASAVLTSGTTPNIAQITVWVGGVSSTAEVEFVAGNYQAPEIMLTVVGELGYSMDMGILVASASKLTHAGLTIEAETLEFDERRGQVRAQGGVMISKGDISVSADALWYSPEDQAGALLIAGRRPQQIPFRADTLAVQAPSPAIDERAFQAFDASRTRSWIVAERANIWPRERIQFTRAQVSVNGKTVLSLPHYFYDYRGNTLNPISQQLRYTAYEGFVLDVPFYFRFREDSSSGLRLRYAGRGSSYGSFVTPRKGISLGLEQMYSAKGGGGRMFVDAFASTRRSLEWAHNQTLSGGRRVNASVNYQPVSEFSRNALSGYTSYAWYRPGLDFTAAVYGNRSTNSSPTSINSSTGNLTTRLDMRTRARPIQRTGLSWRGSSALVRGPIGSSLGRGLRTGVYQTLGFGVAQRPIPLLLRSNLTLDMGLERYFGASNDTSVRARASLSRPLWESGELSLTWDQQFAGSGVSSAYRRSLTGTLSAGKPEGVRGYAFLSWIPDQHSTSLQVTAQKPLGARQRIEVSVQFLWRAVPGRAGQRLLQPVWVYPGVVCARDRAPGAQPVLEPAGTGLWSG